MAGFDTLHKYGIFNLTCPLKQPDSKCLQQAPKVHTVKVMNKNKFLWFKSLVWPFIFFLRI